MAPSTLEAESNTMPQFQHKKLIAFALLATLYLTACATSPASLSAASTAPQNEDGVCLEQGYTAGSMDYWACRESKRMLQVMGQKNDENWDTWLTLRARYSGLVGPGHFVSGCGGLSSLSLGGFVGKGGSGGGPGYDSWSITQGLVC